MIDAKRLLGMLAPDEPPKLPAADAAVPEPTPAAPRRALTASVLTMTARKVLQGHLQNRHQLLAPPPLHFRSVDRQQSELLIRAMVAAANADGRFDEEEHARIRSAVGRIGAGEDELRFLEDAIERPVPLETLLRQVADPQTAMRVYAAALLAVDKHSRVNRSFLQYLADRLQIPRDAQLRVHRQFGMA